MAEAVFFIAALGAIAGAVGTVAVRNPFYSVLALVCHLLSLAALFLLLRAEFVAAAQVVVYAGAVMVLYVFVVAYVGGDRESMAAPVSGGLKFLSALFALALFAELAIAVLGTSLQVIDTQGSGYFARDNEQGFSESFGSVHQIGELFLTRYLVAFEIASLLLLIAAVGAVVLARRRAGLEQPGELSVAELMRGTHGTRGDAPLESQAEHAGPAEAR